jgi:hypothetical protein
MKNVKLALSLILSIAVGAQAFPAYAMEQGSNETINKKLSEDLAKAGINEDQFVHLYLNAQINTNDPNVSEESRKRVYDNLDNHLKNGFANFKIIANWCNNHDYEISGINLGKQEVEKAAYMQNQKELADTFVKMGYVTKVNNNNTVSYKVNEQVPQPATNTSTNN